MYKTLTVPQCPTGVQVHNGDISYARGYFSQWDNFFDQLYPLASRLPYMTCPGNHERVECAQLKGGMSSARGDGERGHLPVLTAAAQPQRGAGGWR